MRLKVWGGLGIILAGFLLYLHWIDPAAQFGQFHDDTIYFSSAQALAEGIGYRLPSLPGAPAATKYPVLYPWILSWVWKWFPVFPSNVKAAVWISAAFCCWFLIAAFVLLRRLPGLGDGPALLIVALCAFHPVFLLLGGGLMSDIPFGALALTAAALADPALRPKAPIGLAVVGGVAAGLSLLIRSAGVAVLPGVVVVALARRAWRPLGVFGVSAVAVAAAGILLAGRPALLPGFSPEGGGPGWQQTWLYYTSYVGYWKLNVPQASVFASVLADNLQFFLLAPATLCLLPPPDWLGNQAGPMLWITLSFAILVGAFRQIRAGGWRPIHGVFLFYLAIVFSWYETPGGFQLRRFILPFVPFFYAGLWTEGRRFTAILRRGLVQAPRVPERVLAAVLTLASLGLIVASVHNYLYDLRPQLRRQSLARASLRQEKEELFDWIRTHTGPATRFISYDDVTLYLATRRHAVWPIAFFPKGSYGVDLAVLSLDMAHFTDVARHIGARYWVTAEDDFFINRTRPWTGKQIDELKSVLPVVFHSRGNRVQLYDLGCLQAPDGPGCQTARAVLPPNSDLAWQR